MTQVILLTNQSDSTDMWRCKALQRVMQRLHSLENQNSQTAVTLDEAIHGLQILRKSGLLSFRQIDDLTTEIWYVPSRDSKGEVWSSTPTISWDIKITEKQKKVFRASEGAVFRLPFAEGNGFIEAFITDWSPFPAAAAIAIHKDHPVAQSVGKCNEEDYYTGRFVRHPLTGDLLPIWIVSWVKPEFGTGAVIVNPAHDRADMDFASKVGLPIRFGLIPNEVTSDPSTWPKPPIIKYGKTTKTGRFDGLDVSEAVQKYFQILNEHGFAEKFIDRSVGAYKIASYAPSTSDPVFLCEYCKEFTIDSSATSETKCHKCDKVCRTVSLEFVDMFKELLSIDSSVSFVLIVPSAEVETSLLFSRLLFYDLKKQPLLPERIYTVLKVQETKGSEGIDQEDIEFASLVAAPINQVAVLKQSVFDQVSRFKRIHKELLESPITSATLPTTLEGSAWKAVSKVKGSLLNMNLQNAFASLYPLQKQLSSLSSEVRDAEGIMPAYYALAYVTAGYPFPDTLNLTDIWNRI